MEWLAVASFLLAVASFLLLAAVVVLAVCEEVFTRREDRVASTSDRHDGQGKASRAGRNQPDKVQGPED